MWFIKVILRIYRKRLQNERRQLFLSCVTVKQFTHAEKKEAIQLVTEDVNRKIAAIEFLLNHDSQTSPLPTF